MNPETEDSAARATLAQVIESRRAEIERRWMNEVTRELGPRDLSETELKDSIPDYLLAIARGLRGAGNGCEFGGSEAWGEVAEKHAVTRVQHGFDVDEVVKEFIILRNVMIDVLRDSGVVAVDRIADRVHDAVGGAIATAVRSYIGFRDQQTSRAQAQHIGFVTHELRNPLTTATLAAEDLIRRTASVPESGKSAQLLLRNLKRLRELIDEVLEVERFQAEEVTPEIENVELSELIAEATEAAEQTAHAKGIEFRTASTPAVVRVDRRLIRSALQNLVDNAVKFTDEGEVSLTVDDGRDEVCVHVRDHCGGLDPQEQENMFKPFKRARTHKQGSGLGLAIVKRAIEAHGKTIHVESHPGEGCHLWLSLPKATH
jgi:signal transduction histidine kinase